MTNDENKQAHMLAAIVAMHACIRSDMPPKLIPNAAYQMADELMSKYNEDGGIVAALKTRKK